VTAPLLTSLSVTSAIVGGTAALSSLSKFLVEARRSKVFRDALTKKAEDTALESSDLDIVGKYLFDTIGGVEITSYVRDAKLRTRTEAALARLTTFVGTETEQRLEQEDPPPPPPPEVTQGLPVPAPVELARAKRNIVDGDVWNGLARARRYIELRLGAQFPSVDSSRMSAIGLVSLAERRERIMPGEAEALRFALNVCNRAIHGEDISPDLALYAVDCIEYGLSSLDE